MPEKKHRWIIGALVFAIPLHVAMAWYIGRHEGGLLATCWILLFALYLFVMYREDAIDIRWLLAFALVYRLLFLFSTPTLSDDIYRYIWDGRLLVEGMNPFEYLPVDIVGKVEGLDSELLTRLNSPRYYSVYPPGAQFLFWISAAMSPNSLIGSILVFRSMVLLVEMGTVFLLLFLAKQYRMHPKNIFWYALNPLVVIELTGSLHLEAFMIFFIVLAFALLSIKRNISASGAFALAISVKLLPLMLLPLMIKRLGVMKSLWFYLFTGAITLILFIPFLGEPLFRGLGASLGLYYQKFEFNAGPYFLAREIGYWVQGYNIIQTAGPYMAVVAGLLIVGYTLYDYRHKMPLAEAAAMLSCIYFSLSTIVHPWYIVPIIALFSISQRKLGVVWSFFVFFSYLGYTSDGFEEVYLVVAIEYLALFLWYYYEWRQLKRL